ncbi:MAG: tRNA guanosine(34) transglycosylase Tgt [Sphaerochaetaceae bacterium]|nr:tRNA guanosine(34) transglycosylase Tgt [Spirochaetales bacterium]MDY5499548.1 tRNA guanosine(34) transglycosylase Tgt [Sphaerochaetaceae bacterium]
MQGIYTKLHQDSSCAARLGVLHLPHGDVETPVFMPVGTNGTVKGIYHDTLREIGFNLILGNTYHLYLRPGTEILKKYGGLHKFCGWDRNILTDSGGFQVFSLSGLRKIGENGVRFQSHIDGSWHEFTPEKVVDIQSVIGSDIAMCLDICTKPDIPYKDAVHAMKVTHAWAARSLARKQALGEQFPGNLFGICQGNFYKDLRKESAEVISGMDFPGIAIGGLSVGESPKTFSEMLAYTTQFVTAEKPRYVMGIGSPDFILDAVENGIDMFDCVLQTRMARNGAVFTDDGVITLKKAKWADVQEPVDPDCGCTCCREYTLGYMHHLFKCNEMLGGMLATEHNLAYFKRLMRRVRQAIKEDRFAQFKKAYLERFYANGGKR